MLLLKERDNSVRNEINEFEGSKINECWKFENVTREKEDSWSQESGLEMSVECSMYRYVVLSGVVVIRVVSLESAGLMNSDNPIDSIRV